MKFAELKYLKNKCSWVYQSTTSCLKNKLVVLRHPVGGYWKLVGDWSEEVKMIKDEKWKDKDGNDLFGGKYGGKK